VPLEYRDAITGYERWFRACQSAISGPPRLAEAPCRRSRSRPPSHDGASLARRELRRAVLADPWSHRAHYFAGLLSLPHGNEEEAKIELRRAAAVRLDPAVESALEEASSGYPADVF
jgi:hypothetical protein